MHLTQAIYDKLDAFYVRGLRIVLGIKHAYWSHVSNDEVIKRANIVANKGTNLHLSWERFVLMNKNAVTKVVPVSQILQKRQRVLLGHILRADIHDPMFEISFNREFEIVTVGTRRAGRPRQHFLESNIQDVYWDLFQDIYEEADLEHRCNLIGQANERKF